MGKKAKKQNKKHQGNKLLNNMLPQNIMLVGERVEANKNIYISQAAYKEIHRFTKNKTTNESGGMLVGTVVTEFGKTNIIINGFIEARFCEATPTTLKFTHETWEYVHKEIEKKHKGLRILGWIHTHPDFGIFLSEYDKFIHQNFFSEDYQVAYVIDPMQSTEGFYFWINGILEKCKGFYIFDKNGVQINVDIGTEDKLERSHESSFVSVKNILLVLLIIAVAFLTFYSISTTSKLRIIEEELERIETQQETIFNTTNQALLQMDQIIHEQSIEIKAMQNALVDAGIVIEPTVPIIMEDNKIVAPSDVEIVEITAGE